MRTIRSPERTREIGKMEWSQFVHSGLRLWTVEVPDTNTMNQYLQIEQERVACYNNIYRSLIDYFERSWLEASIVDTANSKVVAGGNESLSEDSTRQELQRTL